MTITDDEHAVQKPMPHWANRLSLLYY